MSRQATRLWTYRLDAASGRIAVPGRAITPEQATAFAPDFSADGKKLAYVLIPESGPGGAAPQELHEWTETADRTLIADGATRFAPRVSRDGRYIAYRWTPVEGNVFAVSVLDTTTLKERRVTSTSLFATPFGWAPDDQSILMSVRQAAPARQGLFRVPVREGEAPRELSSVAVNPKFDIWQGTQSPDGQWIAFVVQEPSPRWSAIFVVPKAGGQWIQITDGHGWDDKPRWSRDGHLLYFLTSRGGPFAVAAVAIDQTTGKPISAPSELMPLPDPRLAILNSVGWLEMAVGGDALAVPLVETTGGLWTTDSRGAGPGREAAGSQPCPELLPPEVVRKVSAPDWGDVLKRKSGAVQMEVVVGIDGTVRDARIVRSPDARLNPEALRAGAQWTFRPGRCGGEATTSTVPIEVSFAANERR
jgi:TonB family protein